ncbi:MAG: hypothetical protein KatS3mg081_0580 [Gemmatimonadales bacterium]|nr:MAG: hypothetical protein KatS3mg081_0580 [Gemmatimonadales bacterium]
MIGDRYVGRLAARVLLVAVVLAAALVNSAESQRGRRGRQLEEPDFSRYNTGYDGRFVFLRLRYNTSGSFGGYFGGGPGWAHDYPRAERHLMKLLSELTSIRPFMDGGNVLSADDPEIFKYPVAYLSEPGFWTLSDEEATNLRNYLLKGGFLIVDDFEGAHWINFEAMMRRVLPDAVFVELDPSYPIFHSFFDIDSLEYLTYGNYRSARGPATYYGIFENNDPKGRLMVIVNYNNDIGDYWEWSDTGFFPIELSNEAYKLGINYIVYALTH